MKKISLSDITLVVFLTTMAIVVLPSCKKKCKDPNDPNCPNYNPCLSLQPLTADFRMYEKTYYDLPAFENLLDDTCDGGPVVFKAVSQGADSYEWKIGAGVYAKDSVELNFTTAPDSSTIPITLTIHKKRNTSCFPNEDTVLTMTKSLTIRRNNMGENHGGLYYGRWKGYYTDSPNVYSVVTIVNKTVPLGNGTWSDYFMYGFSQAVDTGINGADNYRFISYFFAVNKIKAASGIYGYMRVDSTKQNVEINTYWYLEKPGTDSNIKYTRIFLGKRQ
ncbi:MAG: hypothetical protein ABI378_08405 [Chitinophagaceae bacterium]